MEEYEQSERLNKTFLCIVPNQFTGKKEVYILSFLGD